MAMALRRPHKGMKMAAAPIVTPAKAGVTEAGNPG